MNEEDLDSEIIRQKVLELRQLCEEKGARCATFVLIHDFLIKDTFVGDADFIKMMSNLMVNEPKFKRILNESIKNYEAFINNYDGH